MEGGEHVVHHPPPAQLLPAACGYTICPTAPLTNSQGVEGDQQRHHLQAPASPSQACISHGQAITAGCLMTCCCWWLLGSAVRRRPGVMT